MYQLPLCVIVERKSWGSPTLNSQNKDNYSVTCPRRFYFLPLIPKQTIWHQIKPPSTKTFVNKCIVNIGIYKGVKQTNAHIKLTHIYHIKIHIVTRILSTTRNVCVCVCMHICMCVVYICSMIRSLNLHVWF